ncbi:DUF4837 family protein [Winogradskyella aurantia]|uniref:DUF4837 domain-containing protein n=1 Tax=Winogradskyella aurantia TaxID=1915063 RepID=A0A265UZV4_9FLAO|nr:DUF4837 family protein [Winogradskyella aurantia]OZV70835.1 DUF4837 domain-containing protein [Winogradskyella aurantia]
MRAFFTVLCCFLIMACGDKKEGDKTKYLPASNGNLNNISVVLENELWEGKIGEAIRQNFAAPLPGLPVDEPIFSMRQIPPQVFDGFATRSRIILKVEKGNLEPTMKVVNEAFAKPQTVVVVGGKTNDEIIAQLNDNRRKIIDAFIKEEVKEKQRRIKLSLLNDNQMENDLGFTVDIPSVYRFGKASEGFYWIRKSLTNSKDMDLMFYEVPLEAISESDSSIVEIIKIRDEVTKTKIPGEDGIYMTIEDAYVPSMYETIIDNKKAFEVRGIWEIKGQYMAGPFITYAIKDEVNKRYLIADGYVYAPSLEKRDLVFELESILKSIKIK